MDCLSFLFFSFLLCCFFFFSFLFRSFSCDDRDDEGDRVMIGRCSNRNLVSEPTTNHANLGIVEGIVEVERPRRDGPNYLGQPRERNENGDENRPGYELCWRKLAICVQTSSNLRGVNRRTKDSPTATRCEQSLYRSEPGLIEMNTLAAFCFDTS